jgi:hypothetical protein
MFLRFRLWRLSRRIVRLSRRQARLQKRYKRIGRTLSLLAYRRRFFTVKLNERAKAITLREWLKAIFRRPNKGRCGWNNKETLPSK